VGKQALTGYRDFYTWKPFGVRFAPEPERFTYSTVYDGVGNVSALVPGPACVQPGIVGSEDCLSLNLWTPFLPSSNTTPKKKLKAVMLWIFGGGFYEGTASDPGSDGTNLASRGDVVVVNVNYRLGNLGFLALDDGITNGNYGLQDIITALQWVSTNIEAFGGDPSRVTIFGESSGAAGVRALLASPKTKGLFSGAIMESTPVGFSILGPYSNYSTIQYEFETVATPILNLTGCLNSTDQLQCLRSLDASTLVNLPVIA
jgi:carboxylesterase type B